MLITCRTKRQANEDGDKDGSEQSDASATLKKAKLKSKVSSGFGNFDNW